MVEVLVSTLRYRQALKWSGLVFTSYSLLAALAIAMKSFGDGGVAAAGTTMTNLLAFPVNDIVGDHGYQELFLPLADIVDALGMSFRGMIYCVEVASLSLAGGLFYSVPVGLIVLFIRRADAADKTPVD